MRAQPRTSLSSWLVNLPPDSACLHCLLLIACETGGVTYEEVKAVALLNTNSAGIRVVLGGSTVLNSHQFVDLIHEFGDGKAK